MGIAGLVGSVPRTIAGSRDNYVERTSSLETILFIPDPLKLISLILVSLKLKLMSRLILKSRLRLSGISVAFQL